MKRSVQSCLLLIMLMLLVSQIYAQGKTVTGTVIADADGQPLSRVSVVVKGTSAGTVTTTEGKFTIDASAGQVLVFSSIGFEEKEVTIGNGNNLTIRLAVSAENLKGVVVIGYGTARQKQLVGAASVVAAKEAGATIATNPAQLLIGKAAGVQVVNTSGTPGQASQIIIRGTGSFTSVDPLYVIDGIQANGNIFNSLSTQDIENITILKDASSTAIYGTAAANGVVIITTKRLKSGTPRISVTSQIGTSKAWKQLDLLKAKDYVDLITDYAATKGVPLPAKFSTPDVLIDKTDWQKEMFRNAFSSENDINVSGGSEKVLYSFSLGYITQEAVLKDYLYKKLNGRFALDETLGRFHFGQSLNTRFSKSEGQALNIFFSGVVGCAPYLPIYDSTVLGGYAVMSNGRDLAASSNPVQQLGVLKARSNEYFFNPEFFGEVNIIKGLLLRSQISLSFGGGSSHSFQTAYVGSNDLQFPRLATLSLNDYFTYTFENYLSYNRRFEEHNISATAGISYIDEGYANVISETGANIANNNIQNTNVALTRVATSNEGYGTQVGRTKSFFGRINYSFKDRYVLSGSIRRDGSSNFGKNNRYGNFPGVGAAWNFTEEDFVKTNLSFISNGKLRVGWGRTGNNRFNLGSTDAYTWSGIPAGSLIYSFGADEQFVPGTSVISIANPDLKWEQTDQTDAGIDLGFLNNRLTLTLDWYKRKSNGLLVFVPLPGSAGVGSFSARIPSGVITNAADAENKGFEVSVGYRGNEKGKLNYNVSANFSYNVNSTIALGQLTQVPIRDGSIAGIGSLTYTAIGSPIGSFYGYRLDHVAVDKAEVDALNAAAAAKTGVPGTIFQNGLKEGDFIFKDLNGDGIVTSLDQEVLGNPMPKYMYGLNFGATYNRFDFNLVISGIAGLKLANASKIYTQSSFEAHNGTTKLLERWRKPGDVASVPRAGQGASNLRPSDFFIEDGSYMRCRNVTVGYTFSKETLKNVSLRIYLAAQNLFTITDYSGYDPEVSTSFIFPQTENGFIFRRGIDIGRAPQPRTFIVGIQLQF